MREKNSSLYNNRIFNTTIAVYIEKQGGVEVMRNTG